MKTNFSNVEEYIASAPADVQDKLLQIRDLIREAAPEAEERISYKMPAFYLDGNLVYFAFHRKHIGLYPTSSGIKRFEKELADYVHAKGSVQFPLDKPLPIDLIRRIVRFRVEENRKRR